MNDQNPELTDEAKKEIAEAVRIVREDRILRYLRENKNASAIQPPSNSPSGDPSGDPVVPPVVDPDKPVPPPLKPPASPRPKKRGVYWGDTADDE